VTLLCHVTPDVTEVCHMTAVKFKKKSSENNSKCYKIRDRNIRLDKIVELVKFAELQRYSVIEEKFHDEESKVWYPHTCMSLPELKQKENGIQFDK
jgi:hypothetical protein